MDAIENLLTRGVDKIYPSREELEKVLRSGKKLKLYQGFDPTGARLHIGHAVALRKLAQFQELGHHVIFLIGDFTGMIGDPTGKSEMRKRLTREQVLQNAEKYKEQAKKILRFDGENPVEIKFNSEWLGKLALADILELTSHFSVQQMIERDMFQKRLKDQQEISLVEFLYPVMVAYDAVAMEVDLELGGSDQTFNMLAGRKLHEQRLHKEKFVMTVPLLSDSRGVKIGKTEGNVIGITDAPNEFYGKIMALGDGAIINCFTLLTDKPIEEIEEMKKKIATGENPMIFKKLLAFELTKQFNSKAAADEAERSWNDFQEQKKSTHTISKSMSYAVEINIPPAGNIYDALGAAPISKSKTEIKRLLNFGSIDVNGVTLDKEGAQKVLTEGDIILVGKHTVVKVKK